MQQAALSAIPTIQRRVNSRARRLSLRVKQDGSIVLTQPPRVSEVLIQQFLKDSHDWMLKQWHQLQQLPAAVDVSVPDTVELVLPLLQQRVVFQLQDEQLFKGKRNKMIPQDGLWLVPRAQAREFIRHWVMQQAKLHLPSRLLALAGQHGFRYQDCTIRHAKTRWGSCSAQGNINLNAALMLVPVELLDYVLLHELCHTRQMNHSAKFWYEMLQVDPLYLSHRQQLKQFKMPVWWQ